MHIDPHSPVLARPGVNGSFDIQVGLAEPLILTGLSLDERAFVSSLEGGRAVSREHARRFRRAIAALAGAWVEDAAPAAGLPRSVAVHGCGTLGMAIAELLVRGGAEVALHDEASALVEPTGTFATRSAATCAGAAAATLAKRGVRVRVSGGDEDFAVIVCTAAPDPVLVRRLLRSGVPHVLVVCDGREIWVSHVIVPGVTACARCRELELTAADPAWPYLALQLAGSRQPTRRPFAAGLAVPAAASRTAARVLGWLAEGPTDDPRTGETVDTLGEISVAPVAASPACGCGAAGDVGDEVAARRALMR